MSNLSTNGQWLFYLICFILVAAFVLFANHVDRIRRKTLRRHEDGTYVWTEWHGGKRTSDQDPSKPGGDWYSDGDDGGGDGGD